MTKLFSSPGARRGASLLNILLLVADILLLVVIVRALPGRGGNTDGIPVPDDPVRPVTGDFLDWYTSDAMWDGMPEDGEPVTDFSLLAGTYKGMRYLDPRNADGKETIELLNFTVGGDASSAQLVADWYSYYEVMNAKSKDRTGDKDTVYTGTFADGVLTVSSRGESFSLRFYRRNGSLYAIGDGTDKKGVLIKIALTDH